MLNNIILTAYYMIMHYSGGLVIASSNLVAPTI
jgi:hypothetical protein